MDAGLESLLGALLYEGYALYPYTAGAAKNATPTPFGIVYPPAYAQGSAAAFDRLRLQGVTAGRAGRRHRGRGALPAGRARGRAPGGRAPARGRAAELARGARRRAGRADVRVRRPRRPDAVLGDGARRRRLADRPVRPQHDRRRGTGLDRGAALRTSLLSTHPIVRLEGGTFASPLEREGALGAAVAGCESINTYPILATPDDDVLLGAAIVLPDHPQLAPESRGNLFDGTEIEEALVLHVMALSDGEREQIAARRPRDPRAGGAHRRGDAGGSRAPARPHRPARSRQGRAVSVGGRFGNEPVGEQEVVLDGVTYRPGDKVVLRLKERSDPYDRILDGRVATLERIYYDYDDKLYFGATIDDDPGQDLMRETGRFLFFFAGEVEAVQT